MRKVIAVLCSLFLAGCVISPHGPFKIKKTIVFVGDTKVTIQQIEHGEGRSFVHVHHNETTALNAAKYVVRTQGGRVLTLIHSGKRNIVFHLHHQRYEFDPNRMFTDVGIRKSLKTFGHYSTRAHAEVKKLATQVKRLLPPGKVIAVHNNNGYSIKDYLSGHPFHDDAAALYIDPHQFYRNFYLVTRRFEYNRLKHHHFNTVLQAKNATNDGSLSVYLARRDYVNVEAGYNQLRAQIEMLEQA